MENIIDFNDISNELFIMNRITTDRLWEAGADAYTLYSFYYKTAKWQKTNQVKANDIYIKKCLSWGIERIRKTKKILTELGLITAIQKRKDGRVVGWYIRVNYIVSSKQHIEIQHIENTTSSNQDTNALKELIKMLKDNNINALKEKFPELSKDEFRFLENLLLSKNNNKNSKNNLSSTKNFENFVIFLKKEFATNRINTYSSKINKTENTKKAFKSLLELDAEIDLNLLSKNYVNYVKENKNMSSRLDKFLWAYAENNLDSLSGIEKEKKDDRGIFGEWIG